MGVECLIGEGCIVGESIVVALGDGFAGEAQFWFDEPLIISELSFCVGGRVAVQFCEIGHALVSLCFVAPERLDYLAFLKCPFLIAEGLLHGRILYRTGVVL